MKFQTDVLIRLQYVRENKLHYIVDVKKESTLSIVIDASYKDDAEEHIHDLIDRWYEGEEPAEIYVFK